MRIQNNIAAHNSNRQYGVNTGGLSKNMEKLSSGFRINRAGDDAAGLAISEKMRTQIRGLSRAGLNVQDGISLLQVADGALQNIHDIMQRMRELAVQAANGTNDDTLDRNALDLEYQQLMREIDDIVNTTNFNGVYPLKGTNTSIPFNSNFTDNTIDTKLTPVASKTYDGVSFTSLTDPTMPSVPIASTLLTNLGVVSGAGTTTLDAATLASFITGTAPPGTTLNIPATPAYAVDAALLQGAGVANINIAAGGRLVIQAGTTVNGNLTFSGGGQARIEGTVNGNVTNNLTGVASPTGNFTIAAGASVSGTVTNGAGGRMLIQTNTGITVASNAGDMVVTGTGASVTSNSGNLFANARLHVGTNQAGAQLYLANPAAGLSNHQVDVNNGHADIRGSAASYIQIGTNNGVMNTSGGSVTVANNAAGAQLTMTGSNGSTVTSNSGNAWISGNNVTIGNTVNGTGGNFGDMLISGQNIAITTNGASGRLFHLGGQNVTLTTNLGQALFGTWANPSDNVVVTTNSGQVQFNYGANPSVVNNNGSVLISNTSMNVPPLPTNFANIQNNRGVADVRLAGTSAANGAIIGTNFSGADLNISGAYAQLNTNANGGRTFISGNNVTVSSNRGAMQITGSNSNVLMNFNGGSIRYVGAANAALGFNFGRVEIAAGSTMTGLGSNEETGIISVQDNGIINSPSAESLGIIHVGVLAIITIGTNHGDIISKGTANMSVNKGYVEIGEWMSDAATDPRGSATGGGNIGTNDGGLIRNFSQNLTVGSNIDGPYKNTNTGGGGIDVDGCPCGPGSSGSTGIVEVRGGTIDNYGTMTITGGGSGSVHHHVRQIDVSNISKTSTGPFSFWANGVLRDNLNLTVSATDGTMSFGPLDLDGGTVIFRGSPAYRGDTKGLNYDIQDRVGVAGDFGTNGATLVFEIDEDEFLIQSGANQGDVTELDFRAFNTMYLAAMPDASGCICNLSTTNLKSMASANCAIARVSQAINDVSLYRAELGAQFNRLEYKHDNLGFSTENLSAAESRIRDLDMAKEMTVFTKNNILVQSTTAMLAQANALPQGVLSLLG